MLFDVVVVWLCLFVYAIAVVVVVVVGVIDPIPRLILTNDFDSSDVLK